MRAPSVPFFHRPLLSTVRLRSAAAATSEEIRENPEIALPGAGAFGAPRRLRTDQRARIFVARGVRSISARPSASSTGGT